MQDAQDRKPGLVRFGKKRSFAEINEFNRPGMPKLAVKFVVFLYALVLAFRPILYGNDVHPSIQQR